MTRPDKERRNKISGRRLGDLKDDIMDNRMRIALLEQGLKHGEATLEGVRHVSDAILLKVKSNSEAIRESIDKSREHEIMMLKKQKAQMWAVLGTFGSVLGAVGLLLLEWWLNRGG